MVYKHAISTIVPGRAVNFSAAEERRSRRGLNWRGARRFVRRAILDIWTPLV